MNQFLIISAMPDTEEMMVKGSGKLNVEKDLNYAVAKMMSEEYGIYLQQEGGRAWVCLPRGMSQGPQASAASTLLKIGN